MQVKNFWKRVRSRLRHNSPAVLLSKATIVPRVTSFPPVDVSSVELEMHVLVSSRDVHSLLWSLASYFRVTSVRTKVVIHADPTLTSRDSELLKRCLKGVQIVGNDEANVVAARHLIGHPRCAQLRNRSVLCRKVFDFFWYGSTDRILFGDSDVLFFEDPLQITNRDDGENAFIEDHWTNYVLPATELSLRAGVSIPERVNIGFGVVNREMLDLDYLEKLLGDVPELLTSEYLWDQTAIACMAARETLVVVGDRYRMISHRPVTECVLKHYTRACRELLYTEGIPDLYRRYSSPENVR